MTVFANQTIRLSNGQEMPIAVYLCEISQKNSPAGKAAYNGLSALLNGSPTPNCPAVSAFVQNGEMCFDTNDSETIVSLALFFLSETNGTVCQCESCGRFFVPLKRSDEKYCPYPPLKGLKSCRKIGAAQAFRKKKALDENYTLFLKNTKHLRYLKGKGALDSAEYERLYAIEKAALSNAEIRAATPPEPQSFDEPTAVLEKKMPVREKIETYLL